MEEKKHTTYDRGNRVYHPMSGTEGITSRDIYIYIYIYIHVFTEHSSIQKKYCVLNTAITRYYYI